MGCSTELAWLGFWLFLAVFVACDYWLFAQGYDSCLQRHKTAEEKELQKLKLKKLRKEIERDT